MNSTLETPADVMQRLRRGKTWLWARVRHDPKFPRPIYLSKREPMFVRAEVDAFIAAQIAARDAGGEAGSGGGSP